MKAETKKVLKYTLTPQLMPRIQDLFYSGFSYVAFFMAQTYRAVRLLPDGHPYLSPANMGRFGIRHVVAEAGNHLEIKKENIDQIAIYVLMILGIILMAAQLFILFVSGFVEVAHAAGVYPSSSPLNFFAYFKIGHANGPDPGATVTHDLAFVLLDRVFGIPGVGGAINTSFFTDSAGGYTCVVQGIECFDLAQSSRDITPDRTYYVDYARTATQNLNFPWPYHEALRGMLQVYSVGLLVIGVFIFLYFIFAVAAETAQTGTAFGRRFNHLWVPVRLVVAMGLLVPITYGLNSAQWVLMYAAKWGSAFATNGWVIYNNALTGEETLLGAADTLVARPDTPPVNTLMAFGSILATCKISYERMYHERIGRAPVEIDAWLVNPENITLAPVRLLDTSYADAVEYFNGGTVNVRFGAFADNLGEGDRYQTWDGSVAPLCGEISLDQTYTNVGGGVVTEPGSLSMLLQYYLLVFVMWDDITSGSSALGAAINFNEIGEKMASRHISYFNDKDELLPTPAELTSLREAYEEYINFQVDLAVVNQQGSPEWAESLTELGWGGAAVWYNKIAQLNGGLVSAVFAMPTVKKYPFIMEETRKKRAGSDGAVSGENTHRLYRGTDGQTQLEDDAEKQIADAMYHAETIWRDHYADRGKSSSVYIDAINTIFGTGGLFSITRPENQNIHPLAQLSAIGRALVDSAIRNLGYSVAAGLGGGLANLFQQYQIGSFSGAASSFFFQVAMIGLAIGFVLFYVIPFLPFIYFFFAVGGWIKAVFEAMVGVPLWALAHIRIDGEGLPGDAAMGGYYLILEIFLRPLLIVFGFIAGLTIFTAQVQILNEIWSFVVSNVAGFSVDVSGGIAAAKGGVAETGSIEYLRGAVDEFFFTIMYAILCYMMAMSSFKLIDLVPNHVLRWMGASVSSFGDQSGDTAQNLVRNSFIGANMVSGPMKQAAGGLSAAGKSGGQALGELTGRSN